MSRHLRDVGSVPLAGLRTRVKFQLKGGGEYDAGACPLRIDMIISTGLNLPFEELIPPNLPRLNKSSDVPIPMLDNILRVSRELRERKCFACTVFKTRSELPEMSSLIKIFCKSVCHLVASFPVLIYL